MKFWQCLASIVISITLALDIEDGDCLFCDERAKRKVESIKFKYNPEGKDSRFQGSMASCDGDLDYPTDTTVRVGDQQFHVKEGTEIEIFPSSLKKSETYITFHFDEGFACSISIACSVPIVTNDQIGPFVVVSTVGDSFSCEEMMQTPTSAPQNETLPESEEFSGVLSSLSEVEGLRAGSIGSRRVGNVNVIEDSGKEIGICHIAAFLPFTNGGSPTNAASSYESAAALALAAHHLNIGDGSIAKEIEGLNERCNIRFSVEFQDTTWKEFDAVDGVVRATDRDPVEELLPCAFAGAVRSSVSIPTSTITGIRGFPQISAISTSPELDDTSQFPLFGRTIPSDKGTASVVVRHLHEALGVKFLAVLHVNDEYGNAYAQGIYNAAKKINPNMRVHLVEFPFNLNEADAKQVIKDLKETEYTFFFGIIYPTDNFYLLMTEAYMQDIAGTRHHNWLFGDSTGNDIIRTPYKVGSPLAKALRGTGLIAASAGVSGYPAFDRLSESLASLQNPYDITYLERKFQEYVYPSLTNGKIPILNDPNFGSSPGIMGPFMYDLGILIGLSACAAKNGTDYFDGIAHFNQMLNESNSFAGASGDVILDEVTGTRKPESAYYTLLNYVQDDDVSNTTHIYYKSVESRLFRNDAWNTLQSFIFNDGTSTIPKDLFDHYIERNYINNGLRITGFVLCAIILSLSLGFSIWTHLKGNSYVIKASQPIFLHIICAGSAILGSAIIPLAIDMGITNQESSDRACQAYPWFVSIGIVVIFSALFTKTHRLNKLYFSNFKRIKVTALDVAKPMIILITVNVLILALWTSLAPPTRVTRTLQLDRFGRQSETFSYCHADGNIPYLTALIVVNLGVVMYSVYEAWKGRKISTEFAESEYIFMAMTLILLVFFMGIPILIIASENTNAYFFVFTGIIFTCCLSILFLIFIPKIKNRNAKRETGTITGVNISTDVKVTSNEFISTIENK